MVLSKEGDGWRVKIKTKTSKVSYSLSATELEQAVLEAEQLYADARAINNSQPRCMDCTLGDSKPTAMPSEGRMTGGTFAKDRLLGNIPTDAMDYGDGFYITQGVELIGEPRYCSCGPDGQRHNDLWQADIIQHMKNAKTNH